MPRAPRRCPGDNGNCTELIRDTRYCEQHSKPWGGERSRSSTVTSTAAWKRLRVKVLKRDNYRCQLREPGCTGDATQVDHITNTAAGGAELDPDNCQSSCPTCNARKAQREAVKARTAWKRKPEQHPGMNW